MDESTLRGLATELLAELPAVIPDPAQRRPIAEAISAALGVPEGEDVLPLLGALRSHEATRRWIHDRTAEPEDSVRTGGALPGMPTMPLGLYYVCPHEDEDDVLLAIPAQPPLCPRHGVPMELRD